MGNWLYALVTFMVQALLFAYLQRAFRLDRHPASGALSRFTEGPPHVADAEEGSKVLATLVVVARARWPPEQRDLSPGEFLEPPQGQRSVCHRRGHCWRCC